jgi:hypothetical protein
VEPREWLICGAKVGRRIPNELRAPYRNIMLTICKEQEKQARMGNPIEMMRTEKLLILSQAMLHRIPKREAMHANPKKAATLRAKQLHNKHHAFTKGSSEELLEAEDMLEKGSLKKSIKKQHTRQQQLGEKTCTVKMDNPTVTADSSIAYIRDGNMGKP